MAPMYRPLHTFRYRGLLAYAPDVLSLGIRAHVLSLGIRADVLSLGIRVSDPRVAGTRLFCGALLRMYRALLWV